MPFDGVFHGLFLAFRTLRSQQSGLKSLGFLAATGLFAAVTSIIPPWGIAPIILFVGLAINQDAFNVIETRHIPAAPLGVGYGSAFLRVWARVIYIIYDISHNIYSIYTGTIFDWFRD